jgi:hypothetical protein
VCSSGKAATIRGGETRREISALLCRATRKSTSFWLAKSAGTWESTNHETRAEDEQEKAHHREPLRSRRQGRVPGGGQGEVGNAEKIFTNLNINPADVKRVIQDEDDFGHEMRVGKVFSEFEEIKIDSYEPTAIEKVEHGGTYTDPSLGKPRQFDYRCQIRRYPTAGSKL